MEGWTTGAPYLGVAGLIVAFIIYLRIKAGDAGNAKMVEISDLIHEGAMAFLKREYSILLVFVAVVFAAPAALLRRDRHPHRQEVLHLLDLRQ